LNFSITGSSAFEHIDENTISYSGVKFSDKVDVKLSQIDIVNKINESTSIEKDFVLFGFCTNDSGLNNFAIYKIKSLVKKGRSYNMTLQRINEHDDDNNELNFDSGNFICTVEDYVYDIPSGDSIGSVNILSAKANVYAQKHQPKYFVDTIQTKDIVTDESATERNKKHYFELKHTPIIDEMTYMEINGVNYYESADDIIIDRENNRIYFDTEEDDFTFENLQESAETVRVFYKYIPE